MYYIRNLSASYTAKPTGIYISLTESSLRSPPSLGSTSLDSRGTNRAKPYDNVMSPPIYRTSPNRRFNSAFSIYQPRGILGMAFSVGSMHFLGKQVSSDGLIYAKRSTCAWLPRYVSDNSPTFSVFQCLKLTPGSRMPPRAWMHRGGAMNVGHVKSGSKTILHLHPTE